MSIYLAFESGAPTEVASNKGWSNLCRFASRLIGADGLAHLIHYGWSNNATQIYKEMKTTIELVNDPTVLSTWKEMLSLLKDEEGSVVVTDGFTSLDKNISASPFRRDSKYMDYRVKEGFSGKKTDKLGREMCYADGKPVPCGGNAASKPAKPKPSLNPNKERKRDRLARRQQEASQGKPGASKDSSEEQKTTEQTASFLHTIGSALLKAPVHVKQKAEELAAKAQATIDTAIRSVVPEDSADEVKAMASDILLGVAQRAVFGATMGDITSPTSFEQDTVASVGTWAVSKALLSLCRNLTTSMCQKLGLIKGLPPGLDPERLAQATEELVGQLLKMTGKDVKVDRAQIEAMIKEELGKRLQEAGQRGVKGGFSGSRKDKLGRERCYQDGKLVPCGKSPKTSLKKPTSSGKQAVAKIREDQERLRLEREAAEAQSAEALRVAQESYQKAIEQLGKKPTPSVQDFKERKEWLDSASFRASQETPGPLGEIGQQVYDALTGKIDDPDNGLSEEQREEYRQGTRRILGRMPEIAHQKIKENLKRVSYYPNNQAVTEAVSHEIYDLEPKGPRSWFRRILDYISGTDAMREAEADRYELQRLSFVLSNTMAGAYMDGSGKLFLDGGIGIDRFMDKTDSGTAEFVHAHELGHVIDNKGVYSQHPDWQIAYQEEVKQDTDPLTKYAKINASEGWAEFNRALYGGGVDKAEIEKKFPRCSKFVKEQGLWPV